MTYTIEDIEAACLRAAEHEWKRNVRDDDKGKPGDRGIITGYYRGIGQLPLLPVDEDGRAEYRETVKTSWCGAFAAFCGVRVGDFLEEGQCVPVTLAPEVAATILISTYRLAFWDWPGGHKAKTYKLREDDFIGERGRNLSIRHFQQLDCIRPGALVTIKTRDHYGDYRDRVGGHIVRARSRLRGDGTFDTIEGNGRGVLGDGSWGEGVVVREGKHARRIENVRVVYQLDLPHYDNLEPG